MFGKHIFRSIKARPLQPIMIVAVIMISVAVMITSFSLPMAIYRNEKAEYETDEWTPDLSVSLKSTSKMRLLFKDEVVQVIGDRGRVIGEFELGGFLDTLDENGERVKVKIVALDLIEADSFYELRYTDYGKFTDKNLKASAIISESFADENGLSVGDRLTFNVLGNKFDYTVQAIAKNTGIFRNKNCLIDISGVRGVLAERSPIIASLSDDFEPYTRIHIQLNDESMADAIKAELESMDQFADKRVALKRTGTEGDFLATVLTLTTIIPAILLVIVSSMLMVSSFELLQKKRLSDTALFKIVGADEGHINAMMYLESMIYGTVGGIFGCILAYPATLWLNHIYNFKNVGVSYGLTEILIGLGASIIFTLTSTVLHIRKEKRKSLASELTSGNFDTDKKFTVKKLLAGIPMIVSGVTVFLLPPRYRFIPAVVFIVAFVVFLYIISPYLISAVASLLSRLLSRCKRGKGDLILASRACENSYPLKHAGRMMTVLITILVAMLIALSAAYTQLESYVSFAKFDYAAMYCDDTTKDMISEIDGVESTSEIIMRRNIVFEGFTTTTGVSAVGDVDGCFYETILPKEMPTGNNIALSKGVAGMMGLKVGDEVKCTIEDTEYVFILSEIVGTHADFAYYDVSYIDGGYDTFCIRTDGSPEAEEALIALFDERGIEYLAREEFFAPTYRRLNPQFELFGVMMIIIILMTVFGIFNILGEQRIVRTPEFDVLKQNGKTKAGIVRLQIVEVVGLLIFAAIISSVASVILCLALDKLAVSFGLSVFV